MDKPLSSGSRHFVLHQLSRGVFAAIAVDGGAAICNAGLIDLEGQVLVFDTFLTPLAAADLCRSAAALCGPAQPIVINSHQHSDHTWGNQAFAPGTQIISSAITRQLMIIEGEPEFQRYAASASQQLADLQAQCEITSDPEKRASLRMWIGYYAGLVESLPTLALRLPNITFSGRMDIHGTRLSAELTTFECAHTASDTVLYLPQAGIAFVSDLLFVGCHPYLADGDPFKLIGALKAISQMDARCFVPGHGPLGTLHDLQRMIEYIESCLEIAHRLIQQEGAWEEQIAALSVPPGFEDWQMAQFFQGNIQFLCQYLISKPG